MHHKNSDKDLAIIIAFPEKLAPIPTNKNFWNRSAKVLDFNHDGNLPVGHAGIIIINGVSGKSRYFDFGRYKKNGKKCKKNYGIVRSGKSFNGHHESRIGLQIPNADIKDGRISNIKKILSILSNKKKFKGYGTLMASIYYNLDYSAMLTKAEEMERNGCIPFGAPNKQYCARFVREVARAGGAHFGALKFTGIQNVKATANRNDEEIYKFIYGSQIIQEKSKSSEMPGN